MRLHAPLTRDGVVLPLLASCLVLALIAGTLLTVFTAGPNGESNLPGSAGGSHSLAASATSRASSPATSSGPAAGPRNADSPIAAASKQKLPSSSIIYDGKPVALDSLLDQHRSLVIALVPVTCGCAAALRRLVIQAQSAGLQTYLVSARGQLSKIKKLAPAAPKAVLVEDKSDALYRAYPPRGLTALLVHPGGQVGTVSLSGKFVLTTQLHVLSAEADSAKTSSPATTASPH